MDCNIFGPYRIRLNDPFLNVKSSNHRLAIYYQAYLISVAKENFFYISFFFMNREDNYEKNQLFIFRTLTCCLVVYHHQKSLFEQTLGNPQRYFTAH